MGYNHLTIEERSYIYQFLNLGMSIRNIATALRRYPSTISREIKRNSSDMKYLGGEYKKYYPVQAKKNIFQEDMNVTEKANAKYDKENYKYKRMKLHIKNDEDIIEWLESKENINGYLKNLVRNDMNK